MSIAAMPTTARATTPRRITVAEVRKALTAIAALYPGRADDRAQDGLPARYVARGRPNCLVAKVLARLGFSVGVLKALDQEYPTGELCEPGVRVQESRHPALRKITPEARQLLQWVQDRQDRGFRWDQIVQEAFTAPRWFTARDRERRPWLHSSTA